MQTAVVFIKNTAWLNNESCVGVRFDTQIIPAECWIAGMICGDRTVFQLPAGVGAEWELAIEYANLVLSGEWKGDEGYESLL